MRYFLFILLFIFVTFSNIVFAQIERETRAVWVTTNFKLDWPPNTFDETEQKESLRKIFKNLKKKNFNTVYFQVRSNGTVLYKSKFEPFSHYLTGNSDTQPTYDPLKFAIQLGKEYNLEVHAWVNMIRCFSGSDEKFLQNPKHIRNRKPSWTVRVMDPNGRLSYWLNPGYYQVQDYLVDILVEISSMYDVDGIHLDFFRYPNKKFEDAKFFNKYGLNISIEDWRRNNLSTILRKFRERAKPLNPFLKVGVTPIGIRKSLKGATGWEGYSSVYQDTERWLEEELVDYITPQIYWDFEKNPKFDVLAKNWVKKSYNKNVILGLAAYKKDVKPELNRMIKLSKEIDAAGISFFRYANIASENNDYFKKPAFPTNMAWKQNEIKSIEKNILCTKTNLSNNEILISWKDESTSHNKFSYRNYILESGNNRNVLKLISLSKNRAKLKFANPRKLTYTYSISKINRLWNVTSRSNNLIIKVPYLNELKNFATFNTKPILYKQNETKVILAVTSNSNQNVVIDIITKENLGKQQIVYLKMGLNILPIEENFKLIKTLRITYEDNNKPEELNFY